MPTQITKYCCNECSEEYKDYNLALQCESLYCDGAVASVGNIIHFENEETMFGERYSYSSASGTVLYMKKVLVHDKNGKHHTWGYVVKLENGYQEALVVLTEDEFGVRRLVSLAEYKFPLGYADSLRMSNSLFTPYST